MSCTLLSNASEKHIASIFKAEEYTSQEISLKQIAAQVVHDWFTARSITRLRNTISQRIELFLSTAVSTSHPTNTGIVGLDI
jgi:hypothetical protein